MVTADSNLIGRLYRSAIDHRRHSTDAGQCAIGRGSQFGGGGNNRSSAGHPTRKIETAANGFHEMFSGMVRTGHIVLGTAGGFLQQSIADDFISGTYVTELGTKNSQTNMAARNLKS